MAALARRLGACDLTFIVVGSLVGTGIFRAPAVVAERVHSPVWILGAWLLGGVVALFGAFVLGELAARRPEGFGVYAYLREAFHPVVAFAFGWTSLLVMFTGGIAAAAVLFAGYLEPLTGLHLAPAIVATATISLLTLVTCLGVRESGNVQNALTVAKVGAIVGVIAVGIAAHPLVRAQPVQTSGAPMTILDLGVAMIPVLFAYNGAAVASFMAPEAKAAARALPLGLVLGVSAVALLYLLVNVACIQALGAAGLAASSAPISDVLLVASGSLGSRLVALVIVLSTLGFISNRLLTVPRLYYAMARDGLFFRQIARIDPKTCVPVLAIVLQGGVAIVIALSGSYDRILNYVVSTAYLFAGMFALAVFVLRARDARSETAPVGGFRVPGHPVSTILVMLACWGVALDTCLRYPLDGLAGFGILLSAFPVYFAWTRLRGAGAGDEKPGVC